MKQKKERRKFTEEQRQKILQMYTSKTMTAKDIEEKFKVSPGLLSSWKKKYNGGVKPKQDKQQASENGKLIQETVRLLWEIHRLEKEVSKLNDQMKSLKAELAVRSSQITKA